MKILNSLHTWSASLWDFLFPRHCTCCSGRLALEEQFVCSACLSHMPLIRHTSFTDNETARRFWGLIPIRKATSYFIYTKSSPYTHILFDLKYHKVPEIGRFMGRMMAQALLRKGFFEDIDVIVPIPLSREKERKRGYNQSLWIAYGVAEITGLRIDHESVARTRHTPSQTTLSHTERLTNLDGSFKVTHPERLEGLHILLTDDVVTTGSTLRACAQAVTAQCNDVTFSILTLAQAAYL